ncbi:MAG TPA: NAD(P)/FAD-dependent oxidoreductase [Candidatus Angelobacter sp.]
MEKAEYDLIVVGGGPAGCACAITAARAGASVLLLEKDLFPRHKVCGEFVSPESLQLLEWLLGEECFRDRPEISSARIFSLSSRKIISLLMAPPARSIARFELDAKLLTAARRAGVQAKEEVVVLEVTPGTVCRVRTRAETFTARGVVNATGRWSQLTQQTTGKDGKKWIGLKGHFREEHAPNSVDLYFFNGGYCGVQPVSEESVNACAMVRADAARSLEDVFPMHPELEKRSRIWSPVFPAITTSQLYFRPPQTDCNGMLLAGDAAAFIDPFAGDGISLAMQSGTLAAESLAPFFQGKSSWESVKQQYGTTYRKQFGSAFRNAARVRKVLTARPLVQSMLLNLAGIGPFSRALVRSTRIRERARDQVAGRTREPRMSPNKHESP